MKSLKKNGKKVMISRTSDELFLLGAVIVPGEMQPRQTVLRTDVSNSLVKSLLRGLTGLSLATGTGACMLSGSLRYRWIITVERQPQIGS